LCRDFAQAACWLGLSRSCFFRSPAPPLRCWCWCLRLECFVLAHELADADLPVGVACMKLVVLGLPIGHFLSLAFHARRVLPPTRLHELRVPLLQRIVSTTQLLDTTHVERDAADHQDIDDEDD